MALLMLRTHDLSWQDHVANIEFMVNPAHNQLLLNKHKTLASKCQQVKKSFDSEMKTKQKSFIIDMRMMERKRRQLQNRKAEIKSSKGSREISRKSDNKPRSGNNNIPKTNQVRGQSAPPNVNSTFMTEVALPVSGNDDNSSTPSPISRAKTVNVWYSANNGLEAEQRPNTRSTIKSTGRLKSVRFEEEIEKLQQERVPEKELHYRVKLFLDAQIDFNTRPLSYLGRVRESMDRAETPRSPIVAKRYNSTKLDTGALMNVFDDLCQDRSLENFKKLSSLAQRVKTNYKLSRNTSVVPAVGTLKASRRFKDIAHVDDGILAH